MEVDDKLYLVLATTSRVLPYAYIGLTENNLGVLIWWDQTELNESSTFPLYSRSLETDCGSLRFEQNRVDPIHIALYDCFTSLPFICEFKGKNILSLKLFFQFEKA